MGRFYIAALAFLTSGLGVSAQDIATVTTTLDFSAVTPDGADALFETLRGHDGKPILLKLALVPRQDGDDVGYSVSRGVQRSEVPIVCGRDRYGIIDNMVDRYQVIFGHPSNHHTLTSIYIGDRQAFPFNGLICGIEDYTDVEFTPLHISGYFVVVESAIPTQTELTLFPYRP